MSGATTHARIEATVRAVFERLSDVQRWDEWFALHGGWPDGAPTALTEGTQFRQRVTILGASDVVLWTVERLDAPVHVTLAGKGSWGGRARTSFDCRPDGAATRIDVEVDLHAPGPGLLTRRAARVFANDIGHSLQRLDALLRADDVDAVVAPPVPDGTKHMAAIVRLGRRLAPELQVDTDRVTREVDKRNEAHRG